MKYREFRLTCDDGRDLDVASLGDPGGRTLVYHHGSPGSRVHVQSLRALAESGDYFVVALSRPGYGESTRLAGRTVSSVVADVTTALDFFACDTYVAVGSSGGAPHALASAALDAQRCTGAVSIAGVAPTDVDFDWTEGMGPENVEEFALAKAGGPDYDDHVAQMSALFAGATPETVVPLFGGLLSDVDRAALGPLEVRQVLVDGLRDGLARGPWGLYDDDRALLSPWGFDTALVPIPVAVVYGDHDLMVPPTHGRWLAKNVANASVHHFADEGHLSILEHRVSDLATLLAELSS